MASICAPEDFNEYPYNIADAEGDDTDLQSFIDRRERDVLIIVLGRAMYDELIANPTDEPFATLIGGADYVDERNRKRRWDGFKPALIPYIYSEWIAKDSESAGVAGLENTKLENSEGVSPARKSSEAWNKSNEQWQSMFRYLDAEGGLFDAMAVSFGYDNMKQYVDEEMNTIERKNEWDL